MSERVYDTPSHVTVEDGTVIVDGPNGVAVSLTPGAARETGERLVAAARLANDETPD